MNPEQQRFHDRRLGSQQKHSLVSVQHTVVSPLPQGIAILSSRQTTLMLLAGLFLVLGSSASAQVQPRLHPEIQRIQQKTQPAAFLRNPVNRIAMNPYTTMLKRRLTTELHFLRKVCEPSAEQFKLIHQEGLDAVESLAIDYAELQRKRTDVNKWPEPRAFLCDVLQQAVVKVMDDATAAAYQDEIDAREESLRDANVAVVMNLVDGRVVLDADQMAEISDKLKRDWNPDWSSGIVMFTYPQYAVLPSSDVLRPFLSPLQQQLWSYRPTRRNVRLSWQLMFGANELFAASLPEFPDPTSRLQDVMDDAPPPAQIQIPGVPVPQLNLLQPVEIRR